MPKIVLGVDASILTGKMSGIARHCEEIISNVDTARFEVIFFSPTIIKTHKALSAQKVECGFTSIIGKLLWYLVFLPLQARIHNVDVFWSPSHKLPILLSRRIATALSVNDLVVYRYGDTMPWTRRLSEMIFLPLSIRRADSIIAISNFTANEVKNYFPHSKKKISTIHLASSLSKKQPYSASDFKVPQAKYFLAVGTLEPRKNLGRLIDAYNRLPKQVKSRFPLVIAGNYGWGGITIEDKIQRLNLTKYVFVFKGLNDYELSRLYRHAHALVFTSIYEGFGLPIVEANVFGLPIICSEKTALSEIASSSAILVNPFDTSSIAKGMMRLATDKRLLRELSICSIKNRDRFSWQKASEEFETTIESILANKSV